jgi:hypothetical protein
VGDADAAGVSELVRTLAEVWKEATEESMKIERGLIEVWIILACSLAVVGAVLWMAVNY